MKSRMLLAPMMLASIAWLGGCSGAAQPTDDGVTAIQFQDVVVPAGLRLLEGSHESHSVEAASWRHGRFVYVGLVKPAEAASYVRERMPLHNWELVKDETSERDPNATTLRYVRGHYSAEYKFSRVEGRTQLVVEYDTDYSQR